MPELPRPDVTGVDVRRVPPEQVNRALKVLFINLVALLYDMPKGEHQRRLYRIINRYVAETQPEDQDGPDQP